MNVKLLRRVAKHILAKPSRLRMGDWLARKSVRAMVNYDVIKGHFSFGSTTYGTNLYGEPLKQKIPDCGTVGCIAGWTCVLSRRTPHPRDVADTARTLLGIDSATAESLFRVTSWPDDLRKEYVEAKTQRQRAKLVGKRIEQVIG